MRIVVTGLIGQYALGGVVWDYLQYLLGFQELGHDVWYLEDTGMWPYNREREEICADCSDNVAHVQKIMEEFGFGDRWLYRNEPDGIFHGSGGTAHHAESILREADVLVNVSGACWLREATFAIPRKIFIDGDPMFTQINLMRDKDGERLRRVLAHDRHFTFGLNVGKTGCLVPTCGLDWRPTVQPISIRHWENADLDQERVPASYGHWTTVMNWVSYPPVEFENERYGQKDIEFSKFLELPRLAGVPFLIAMGRGMGNQRPTQLLEEAGWKIREPLDVIPDHRAYKQFLAASRGEWSVAKHGYVAARTGWFSCRTACYLACGRPAVVQETGWSTHLPSGKGVIAFSTLEEAVDALRRIEADYETHCGAAREFVRTYFAANRVCDELLNT